MSLSSATALAALRAIGEETRLRLVALLRHGELTVTDLTEICGQSQPRISRHLKLLADAGLVDRHREGAWVYFALVADGPLREVADHVLDTIDPLDRVFAGDLDRLAVVRAKRSAAAQEYFARVAADWDQVRSLHAPEAVVEAAVVEAVGDRRYDALLDIGTGTGRMLELLAGQADRLVGLDASHSMLAVARANLDRAELHANRVELRQGDVYAMPFEHATFDLVVVHQVLHYLDDPARAIAAAAALVAPGGRLLVVDFAPHSFEFLQAEHNHQRLGFRTDAVEGWMSQAGLQVAGSRAVAGGQLTVQLWLAQSARIVPGTLRSEAREEA
ncbi:MAG TPA: metalloregulator ArsR/SmtB family transcription factor [Ilumatobacter sp.]|nr:metalloregulator ArsR/SmtB family transcription factor [Ilumatobacter sp.]